MNRVTFAISIILATLGRASGQVVTITKIADSSTIAPGGQSPFTSFGWPSVDGSTVVFTGDTGNSNAIYAATGATVTTVVPPAPNTSYNALNYKDGVLLYGADVTGGQSGIYTLAGNTTTRYVDTTMPIPGGTGNFSDVASDSLSNGVLAFSGASGIYTSTCGATPTVSVVANQNTVIPNAGGATFTGPYFGDLAISGNTVAFSYTSNPRGGVYEQVGQGPITVVADRTTPLPGGTGHFSGNFDIPVGISGSNISFIGDQQGVYASINGTLRTIADGLTRSPNGAGTLGRRHISG